MRTAPMHPGIVERRDGDGRTRYFVRVRRNGASYAGTFATSADALAFRAQALAAAEGRADAPEPPRRVEALA